MVPDNADDPLRLDAIGLPDDMADVLAEALPTTDRPTTLADVFDPANESLPPEVPQQVSELYLEEETRHAVHLADGVEYVPCVLDALIVGFLTRDDPVDIASRSPVDDAVVEYRVSDDAVDVTPGDAVVSFGIAPEDATGFPAGADAAAVPRFASCAYINSFPDEQAYERWAASTDAAAVMTLSAAEAAAVAREIAAGPLFEAHR